MTVVVARFEVFGTYGFLAVREGSLEDALGLVRGATADVDATCSRFRTDSDLARVNARPGRWVDVDPLLAAAVRVALDAAAATDGLVDPLLGRAIVSLGYDRDLREVVDSDVRAGSVPPVRPGAWREIEVTDGRVRIPAGTALDLGATAKAWASDLVAAALEAELGCPALVSLGGDLRIAGPDGRPWAVAVAEHPSDAHDRPECQILLTSGGLATSSTTVRRWSRAGIARHHLLDPRTGLPVEPTWRTVTATGPTCVAANTATTAAVVLGSAAPAWLEGHGVTARLVAADGVVRRVGGWPAAAEPGVAA